MVFERGGGTASLGAPLEAGEDVPTCVDGIGLEGGTADDGETGCDAERAGEGSPVVSAVGAASSGLIAGGVDPSSEGSVSARVTTTESPASLVMPPASASTSSKVTWRSAW